MKDHLGFIEQSGVFLLSVSSCCGSCHLSGTTGPLHCAMQGVRASSQHLKSAGGRSIPPTQEPPTQKRKIEHAN